MAEVHVRVRIPSAGTAAGDFVAAHPDARLTCIETSRRDGQGGPLIDHLALVEGVPADGIDALLDDWDRRYGVRAELAARTAFAMRLPLPVARLRPEVAARLKVLDLQGGTHLGHVLSGPHCDLWIECATPRQGGRPRRRGPAAAAGGGRGDGDPRASQSRRPGVLGRAAPGRRLNRPGHPL